MEAARSEPTDTLHLTIYLSDREKNFIDWFRSLNRL